MNAVERALLRRAIDARTRERLAVEFAGEERCQGCGGERDQRTAGCKQCGDRHRSRRVRGQV